MCMLFLFIARLKYGLRAIYSNDDDDDDNGGVVGEKEAVEEGCVSVHVRGGGGSLHTCPLTQVRNGTRFSSTL